jgi:hypothetical protein
MTAIRARQYGGMEDVIQRASASLRSGDIGFGWLLLAFG